MGALDFLKEFEGRVLDAASYQLLQRNYALQEENNRQLKEKVSLLEKVVSGLEQQVNELRAENGRLSLQLSENEIEHQFITYEGFAFKQSADGKYEPMGYCPTCKVIMSNSIGRIYICPKCQYNIKPRRNPDVIARELNEEAK